MKPNKSGPFLILKTLKNATNDFVLLLNKSIKDFRDSYQSELNDIKLDLLKKISEEYDIQFEELTNKYIKKVKSNKNDEDTFTLSSAIDTYDDTSELLSLKVTQTNSLTNTSEHKHRKEDNILYKVVKDNITYYVESKENGNIYDIYSNVVGKYINNNLEIDIALVKKYITKKKNEKYGLFIQNFLKKYGNI